MTSINASSNPWYSDIPSKLITGIVVGFVLAIVNHFFWLEQNDSKKLEIRINNKIEIYSELAGEFTRFITNHNLIAGYNKLNECDNKCLDEKVEIQLQRRDILPKLATTVAKTSLLFPKSHSVLKETFLKISNLTDNPNEYLLQEDEIVKSFQSILNVMSEDIRNEIE